MTGKDCSSDDDLWETAAVVSILVFLLLVGCTNSDNMGNKESRDSFFSVNDGINLCKFPIVDVVRVVFLLYHMNSKPKTINIHQLLLVMPKLIWVTKKRDNVHL